MDKPGVYIIRPISAYLYLRFMENKLFFPGFFCAAIGLGGWSYFLFHNDLPQLAKYSHIFLYVGLAALVVLAGAFLYSWFDYRRIRYVFAPEGITMEHGINFEGDYLSWQQLNDVNVYRSILQQFLGSGCGTLELSCARQPTKRMLYVPDSQKLYLYFKDIINKNLSQSRRITSM
jgi:hypothetical protein